MGVIVSQITSLMIVFSTVYLETDQRKHQSSASLAYVRGIHRRPVNSLHKWPVMRKMFPYDDVIMQCSIPSLQWHHNEHDGVSNHQRLHCLLNCLFRRRSKKTSKLCIAGLCEGNPSVTSGFPSQRASNMQNISIWWRHHVQWDDQAKMCLRKIYLYRNWKQYLWRKSHFCIHCILYMIYPDAS